MKRFLATKLHLGVRLLKREEEKKELKKVSPLAERRRDLLGYIIRSTAWPTSELDKPLYLRDIKAEKREGTRFFCQQQKVPNIFSIQIRHVSSNKNFTLNLKLKT